MLHSELLRNAVLERFRIDEHVDGRRMFLCKALESYCEADQLSMASEIKQFIEDDVRRATDGKSQYFPRIYPINTKSVYGSFPRNFDGGGESQLQVAVYGLLLAEYIRTDYDQIHTPAAV